MEFPFFQIDAFADEPFRGNPAAVCVLEAWLPDEVMRGIARENNLSETAFIVPTDPEGGSQYHLRWFTPKTEVDLCGHGTLAAGYAVLAHLRPEQDWAEFSTRSGTLTVKKGEAGLEMELPTLAPETGRLPAGLSSAMGAPPIEVLEGAGRLLLRYRSATDVEKLTPRFLEMEMATDKPVIVTAQGEDCDFVLRFFSPAHGVNEDPVTGSAFCIAGPFWASRLGKTDLHVKQLSRRGGEARLSVGPTRTTISGNVVEIIRGTFTLE